MPITLSPERAPISADADGVMRVGGTRVTLDTLVAAFRDGLSAEAMVEQYPAVTLGEAYAVIAFYLGHEQEVRDYLQERERQAGQVRSENEAKHGPSGVRERLLARRQR